MPMRLRYPDLAPEGYAALSAFGHYINTGTALSPVLLGLVNLRASLLNGCSFCIGLHSAELRKLHEPDTRIEAVAAGVPSDAFTPREQAALRWTDVITQIGRSHASDEDYLAVTQFFREKELVDLTFAIANINAWNRMGVAFRPEWRPRAGQNAAASSLPAVSAPASAPEPESVPSPAPELHPEISAVNDDGGKVAED